MLNPGDRVKLRHSEKCVTGDGVSIFVPLGHEGIIVELSSFAVSCQSRWASALVLLNLIDGVNYTLKIEPAYLEKI